MNDAAKHPFEPFFDEIRAIVREEIRAAAGHNGHGDKRPSETINPYLTIKEAANLSRLGQSTIRLLIQKKTAKSPPGR